MRTARDMSVLITGGGTGIGAGIARHFVNAGARVTICGRREGPLTAVASELGDACAWTRADVAEESDRRRIMQATLDHAGGLDVLVHCAANMYRDNLEALDETRLLELFRGNVVGAMMLTSVALPHLIERSGSVVLFGSVHVRRAFPGASPYAATKGALETLTGVLAAELGPKGVRVNCVRPGGVFSELNQRAGLFDDETALERLQSLAPAHALGRIGTPEEVADAVEFLACNEWTTGSVLVVDGGLGLGTTNA